MTLQIDKTAAPVAPGRMGERHDVPVVTVGGLPTVSLTRERLAQIMVADCLAARDRGTDWVPRTVFSANGHGVALAGWNARFARAMAAADAIHADGASIVKASARTAAPLPERIATTDFFENAARSARVHGLRFFMLGASEERNRAAVAEVKRRYPGIDIAGRHHGYFASAESAVICRKIVAARTDVLWLGLGKPRQEFWALENLDRLRGVGWIKTCGGLYGFLSGDERRAPLWMQKAGLEWAFRMLNDPKRLFWRYALTNPYALYRLKRYTARR